MAKRNLGILSSAWTLAEQTDEARGKLHLKERDGKAFYESSESTKNISEALIAHLRQENKSKRISLAQSVNGDEKVIRSVFLPRREALLSMQRYTIEETVHCVDQKVCETNKRLNALQYQRQQKEQKLAELTKDYARLQKFEEQTEFDLETESVIRRVQNELDKARIKNEAAKNITRRYEEIMAYMQEECRVYPAKLDKLEEICEETRKETEELRLMRAKSIHNSEEARKDLHTMEKEMYQAKRARDQQLNETKKEVEKRKEPADKTEKKVRVSVNTDNADAKAMKQNQMKIERQEKILKLETAFEKIKRAINVSAIQDIVFRVSNQDNTRKRLKQQAKEKIFSKTKLNEELQRLRSVFDELKFNSQKQVAKGRKMVEEMQEYMITEEKRCFEGMRTEEMKRKLILDLQSGIATLFEKLKDIKLKPPYHNYSTGDAVEDLINCERKLDVLFDNLGIIKSPDTVFRRTQDLKQLHEYLETKLPPENTRIRFDLDDMSDGDDFHFDHDQDNDGLQSRDDIKRLGQEILDSKLKPKKKRGRKK